MNKSKWYLVVNPTAGKGRGAKHWSNIKDLLKKTGIKYDFGISDYAGHSIVLSKEAVLKGYKKIIAVGGDGTCNEVINGIMDQEEVDTKLLTFAIIPVGTGNDWIKTHQIPKNYKKAILLISAGKTKEHDIGKVYYQDENKKQAYRYFINVAGLAYDAYVTKKTEVRPKYGNNQLYYLYLIISCVTSFKPTPIKVTYDGVEIKHDFFNITVGQCQYNGGGTKLVPQANPYDGLFALTVFKDVSPLELLFKAHRFYNGSIVNHKEAYSTQARHIKIEAPVDKPTFVEVDGEWLGSTPIEFLMLEKALKVIVP